MRKFLSLSLIAVAAPAFASEGGAESTPFFSLGNHELIVSISFLLFVGALIYYGVPKLITGTLDSRAEAIGAELEEARSLREEAQAVLASWERKQKEVADQAEQMSAHARKEAQEAAELAKDDIKASIARRLAAAEDQIKSAETAAVKEVRDTAVTVAIGAAQDLIAKQMTATEGNKLIEASIKDVEAKLH